ncbi:MAG: sugar phosphate isomerase/epimerase family protein [Candidatus Latescibacterota bacterium]|nr:sugar phosphate isomerase/epimerase family protein [Candidatus Latescibacterota bacterium]
MKFTNGKAPAGLHISGFADEISPHPLDQIAGLLRNGVRHVEVRGVSGKNVLDLDCDEVTEFRRNLEEAQIGVSAIGSPIGKVQIRSDLNRHFERFQGALQSAKDLDCAYVRVFSFYHEKEPPEEVRDSVIEQFRRMTDAAERENLVLLHENESHIYGDTPERCLDLLSAIDSPHLMMTFDPANFIQCECSPRQAWDLLADRVEYFHVKDALKSSKRVVPAGHGDGDLEEIFRLALDRGYAGFFSVEHHLKSKEYGTDGFERFATAVVALRLLLSRLHVTI